MKITPSHDLERWLAREVLGKNIGPKPSARVRREAPARDWKYRAWIRTLPCTVCETTRYIEAAHTGRDGGMSQKASDYSCIPLCAPCHRTRSDSYHFVGRREFERRHGLDIAALVARLNEAWRELAA